MPDQSSVCLYRLPENLIRAEFEDCSCLQRRLHSCTALNSTIMRNPDIDMLKVVVKSLLTSLRENLPAFMTTRRDCRRPVLQMIPTAMTLRGSLRLLFGETSSLSRIGSGGD